MRTLLFILTVIVAIATNLPVSAQKSRSSVTRKTRQKMTRVDSLLVAYKDSLSTYRMKLDSLQAANDSLNENSETYEPNGKYYRYFTNSTFYPQLVGNKLSLDATESNNETNALLLMYLRHPEHVKYSARKLNDIANENISDADLPTLGHIEMVKKVKEQTPEKTLPEIDKAPVDLVVTKPHFWTFVGDYYLQFMQNHFSENWYKSSSNNYSMLAQATIQYNFNNKQKVKWENKLEMKLGIITSESDTVNKFKASEDLLRLTSKLGIQAHKQWYYSVQLLANTQFMRGYKDNKKDVFSDFMSPFNLNISLGMDYYVDIWKKKLTGTIHLAPLAYNLKYTDRANLAKSFGIDKDHRALNDFGSQLTVELTWKPIDMLKWETKLYCYTTYHKFTADWENTISFNFNKFISAKLFLYPRFDDSVNRDNDFSYWQFHEYLSFGFSYSM